MSETNTKLAPPWEIFYREVKALFENDPEIEIKWNYDTKEIKLLVDDASKADALMVLLPTEKHFGNETVKITVVPANDHESAISLYQRAFAGNPALSFIEETEGPFKAAYAVFAKRVVQFPADNIGDIYGNITTLYQNIAEDVLVRNDGEFFCTDKDDPDEWDFENSLDDLLLGRF